MENWAEEIYKKLGKVNNQKKEIVVAHCQIVATIAKELAVKYQNKIEKKLDLNLIEVGAMIHDVGCLRIGTKKMIVHGEEGYKWLKKNSFSENLARFCLTHVGVGFTEKEAQETHPLDLTLNHMPQTIEEKIVAYADKFASKGRWKLYINSVEEIEKQIIGYSQTKFNRWKKWKEMFGIPALNKVKKMTQEYNRQFLMIKSGNGES